MGDSGCRRPLPPKESALQALATAILKRLDLPSALMQEAVADRNLLPPEPGWQEAVAGSDSIVKWITGQLRAGWVPAPQHTVAVRKSGHGVRPVPIWSIPDRIIYRALVNVLLSDEPPLDRSTEAYLEFVRAPHTYSEAVSKQGKTDVDALFFYLFDSPFEYVVKSDIAAFYQYVDHAILGSELLLKGQDYEVVDALMQLLQEVQGRSYGLPQLLEPSDRLSEVYIDRVERALIRDGFHVWRYNDDFRVGCTGYPEALNALEKLDSAARDNGLIISESKTFTYRYGTYVMNHLGLTVTADKKVISGDEVEDVVGDYTDEFGLDDLERAMQIISGAQPDADQPFINLREARSEHTRLLRRALNGLAAAGSADAVPHVKRLLEYIPSLTPTLIRYLVLVSDAASDEVDAVLDAIYQESSLNEWQKIWVLHGLSEIGGTHSRERLAWVSHVSSTSPSSATRAAAWGWLAEMNEATVGQLVEQADSAPTCLQSHYMHAIRVRVAASGDADEKKRLDALASDNALNSAILK